MQAAVAEGCAFFPVFLSRFFLIFFPGKHRDRVKVGRTNHFDCCTDFGEVNICQIISFAESRHLSHEPIRCLQLHLRLKSSESSPWLLRSPWQSGFTTSEMARRDIFWRWWEMWHCECWWPSLKRSSLYMSKSLNQVRGFWISMPTFLTNSFGCKANNLVLVLRPTVGQTWRISSEEKVQISLKWPPSDCPCRPDSLSPQRSALTSTRTTASILRSLNNRRFWPTDGLLFFSRHGCVQCRLWFEINLRHEWRQRHVFSCRGASNM